MKVLGKLILGVAILALVSCKSGVTLQQLQKQENEAREELQDVQAELQKLVNMKEQYSVDGKKAAISDAKDRLGDIDNEIGKLESVKGSENSGASGAAKDGISSLKSEQQKLKTEISRMETMPKENWATSLESINQSIKALEMEVNKIMQNVKGEKASK